MESQRSQSGGLPDRIQVGAFPSVYKRPSEGMSHHTNLDFSDDGALFHPVATLDDISNCFRLILGRLPSRGEWGPHSALAGKPLQDVVATYFNSNEFFNRYLMQPFGNSAAVDSAPFLPTATLDDIFYCFRLILGRLPSRGEWTGHSARVGERLQDVVATYFNSAEFFSRRLAQSRENSVSLVPLEGFSLFASQDDIAVGKHIIASRNYEPNVSGIFRQIVKPGMHLLDVGANIGFYTMLGASLVGPNGKVWAVEPNPNNVRMILASRAKNGFEHVAVIQAAAGESWETMCIFSDASNASVARVSATEPSQFPQTVLSLPLDVLLGDHRVDVIKIDVEGSEGCALRGGLRVLERNRPVIFCEFTPDALPGMSNITAEQYLEFLIDLDYDLAVLLDRPVECGREIDDVMSYYERLHLGRLDLLARPSGFQID